MQTLQAQGYAQYLACIPEGSSIKTDNLTDVWNKTHHSLIQNHLGQLIVALGLEGEGGWAVVRKGLEDILGNGDGEAKGRELRDYLMGEEMIFKCFLRMAMVGKYRDVGSPGA